MKFLIFFTCTFALIYNIYSDTWSMDASDPDNPGMCEYERKLYSPGEYQIESRCIKITCSQSGWISVHSCIKQAKIPGCFRGAYIDRKKPFPDCCKRLYSCTAENGTDYEMIEY